MTDEPHNLILDHLRAIRTSLGRVENDMKELKQGNITLCNDVHALRGDVLRQERALAAVESDVDRIKTRLDLTD